MEKYPSSLNTRWSSTLMPMMSPAWRSLRVTSLSSTLGSRLPLGWLWATRIAVALCLTASTKTSGYLPVEHMRYLKFLFPALCVCFVFFSIVKCNLIAFSVLFGFIAYSPSAHFTAMAIELSPEKFGASAASLQNFFMQIGAFIMPTITSFILNRSGNYSLLWAFFAFLVFLASGILQSINTKGCQSK